MLSYKNLSRAYMKNLNENFKCFMDPMETLPQKWHLSKDTFFVFLFSGRIKGRCLNKRIGIANGS
jgi:hypothetical protein